MTSTTSSQFLPPRNPSPSVSENLISMSTTAKYRVAICGAGVGGLTLAVVLGKYSNVPIDLYETQADVTITGAGISVWRRTREIMIELGLYSDLGEVTTHPPDASHGHWVSNVSQQELLNSFKDFEPEVRAILQCCERPSKWALHVTNDLHISTSGHVAIIGDACHAMTPNLGAGAGQAIEDAFILGRLLSHELTTLSNLPDVLRIYQDIRLPVATQISQRAASTGYMYDFVAPGYYDGKDRSEEEEGLARLKDAINENWDWLAQEGSLSEWTEAERRLKELASQP
ncbi:hypothetical protein SERLA73DRAFT_169976 [Serpula lacrymans var. lacrymans S7.3]|uniref:FAD-binding domain-containing protein n=1 Tax=Serpula lacrymans var. lacrymans (strain S7.3) TaxID=936435 RepID=F8Q3H8_SERL3|nr:hypothetical protein SERLA73DRAFT_169976 [Serpula lacrymans var. lacrymans S7.3]